MQYDVLYLQKSNIKVIIQPTSITHTHTHSFGILLSLKLRKKGSIEVGQLFSFKVYFRIWCGIKNWHPEALAFSLFLGVSQFIESIFKFSQKYYFKWLMR